ncbi:MAG: NUDIX domain-containing protein [Sphingobacteriia bacterium]|nr:MAG: NUDIX domain-containing protein [Sphingobacteriia bacterium]
MALFNVRVYGFLTDTRGWLLVSDEIIKGKFYTKLPGGGLEFGEGTRDCLQREFKEETGLSVQVGQHLYTTDFFQVSAFDPSHQILSIYYRVHALEDLGNLTTQTKPFAFSAEQLADPRTDREVFRWVAPKDWQEDLFSLPIDKIALQSFKQLV